MANVHLCKASKYLNQYRNFIAQFNRFINLLPICFTDLYNGYDYKTWTFWCHCVTKIGTPTYYTHLHIYLPVKTVVLKDIRRPQIRQNPRVQFEKLEWSLSDCGQRQWLECNLRCLMCMSYLEEKCCTEYWQISKWSCTKCWDERMFRGS